MNLLIIVIVAWSNGRDSPPSSRRAFCWRYKWDIKSKICDPSIGFAEMTCCYKFSQMQSNFVWIPCNRGEVAYIFDIFFANKTKCTLRVSWNQNFPWFSLVYVGGLQGLGGRQQETKTDGEVCLVSMLGQHACLDDLGSSSAPLFIVLLLSNFSFYNGFPLRVSGEWRITVPKLEIMKQVIFT